MKFFSRDKKSAFEAKEAAQWIAHGPVIFQVARVLRNSGILKVIEESVATGDGKIFRARSTGKNPDGETVAEFFITWSFKAKPSSFKGQ